MKGGTYDWNAMTLVPADGCSAASREAIGKLTYDVGVSVGMNYGSGGSSSAGYMLSKRFVDRFRYANAACVIFKDGFFNGGGYSYSLERLKTAVVPNFDAGLPVVRAVVRAVVGGKETAVAKTNAKGVYALRIAPGKCQVVAEKDGNASGLDCNIVACVSPEIDEYGSYWSSVCPQNGNLYGADLTLEPPEEPHEPEEPEGQEWRYETFAEGGRTYARILAGEREYAGDLAIPPTLDGYPVREIGAEAFYKCAGLTSLTIPRGVTLIREGAFYNYSGLKSVTIPEGVTQIGPAAFAYSSPARG